MQRHPKPSKHTQHSTQSTGGMAYLSLVIRHLPGRREHHERPLAEAQHVGGVRHFRVLTEVDEDLLVVRPVYRVSTRDGRDKGVVWSRAKDE